MNRKRQQNLFDQIPKRGRKPLKPEGHFGGIYLKNYNPKSARPLDSKKALHLVLKSSQATGSRSFKSKANEGAVWAIIQAQAKNFGVKIYEYANSGNHLHILLRAKNRFEYAAFIRSITGLIARHVGRSEKGSPLKRKFWDARPFSRIVSFARKEFQAARVYILRNTLEIIGWMPYVARNKKLPSVRRQWLMAAVE
ncbi:MAG: transposase [Bdellovibrionales bacterium]|nr:transposase [Bdellovibrionales bacterium]